MPIFSALYLLPIFYIFEKRAKNLKIPVLFLSFVDNRLNITFIPQERSFEKINSYLFYSYIISFLLEQFGLIIEHRKFEIFHFSRLCSLFNSPLLNLSYLRGPILCPKETWEYFDFIFNRKLLFQHVKFYSNKALLTIKYMKIVGNSTHRLLSYQRHLLYRIYILLIALYRFPL